MKRGVGFWGKIKLLFSNPVKFYSLAEKETKILPAFWMFLIVSLVTTVITLFIWGFIPTLLKFMDWMDFGELVVEMMAFYVVGVISFFLIVGFIHIFVKLFKGKYGYNKTFIAFAYALVPSYIIGLIPIVGFLGSVYSLILGVLGLMKLQKMTAARAVFALIVPFVIMTVLATVLIMIAAEPLL